MAARECYLHHPCSTFGDEGVRSRARDLLGGLGAGVIEQTQRRCCGFGGNVHSLSTELADAFTLNIIAAAGKAPIVTYCMACKDRFMSKGKRTYHLLEFLVSAKPVERPVSPARKWLNQFLLALRMRLMDAWRR